MTETAIFQHLFAIADRSTDTDGVVTSCLVRVGEIVAEAVSDGPCHAEYMLLKMLRESGERIAQSDVVYVTLQPCDRRTPGGVGETLGDCTTNLITAGVKHIVYAAPYPKSPDSIARLRAAGVTIRQTDDVEIHRQAALLFNNTNDNSTTHLPVPAAA